MTRARDLSKLSGPSVFTIDASSNVGVGTTVPDAKLDVIGVVSATSYYGDGSNLDNVTHVRLRKNMGVGYCFNKVIKLTNKEFIVHQTVDWSYDIYAFIKHIDLLKNKELDVIHGFRGKTLINRSDNLWRGYISLKNYNLIGILFGFFANVIAKEKNA